MDCKRLGTDTRPEQEIMARQSLEFDLSTKREMLVRLLDDFEPELQMEVSHLIEHLLTGDIDFAAEAAIDGTSTERLEIVGDLYLRLIASEFHTDFI